MSTIEISKKVEGELNNLVKQSLTMERNNMLLKRALRLMAHGICLNENGDTTLELTEGDSEFIKSVCNQCDVFNTGENLEKK